MGKNRDMKYGIWVKSNSQKKSWFAPLLISHIPYPISHIPHPISHIIFSTLFLFTTSLALSETLKTKAPPPLAVKIVHPPQNAKMPFLKKSFILGSVSNPKAKLWVNGSTVSVYRTGSYVAMIPFTTGEFQITAEAEFRGVRDQAARTVFVSSPIVSYPAPLPIIPLDPAQPMRTAVDDIVMRTGPDIGPEQMGYDLFLPKGVRLQNDAIAGSELRFTFSEIVSGWTDEKNVEIISSTEILRQSILRSIHAEIKDKDRSAILVFDLGQKIPYRVIASNDLKLLTVTLFDTISNVDRIRYGSKVTDRQLGQIRWFQTTKNSLEVQIQLKQKLWGYDVRYEGNDLLCEIIFPPRPKGKLPLSGIKVAVDPGHSLEGGEGAVSPKGIREGEVTYSIAMKLKEKLEKAGAKIFITRSKTETISLPERGKRAFQTKADLFVSLHANAVPDGINPLERRGFSIYYFQPQSFEFAKSLYTFYLKKSGLPDDGLYYGNFAVCRITQMPSVLAESGYLIHPVEEELLLSKNFQNRIAQTITEGITAFIRSNQ